VPLNMHSCQTGQKCAYFEYWGADWDVLWEN
jgi:hypothetical protein